MEDILNKWTTELNHYHTEFQKMAVNVGKWDQMIIQNGAQVSYYNYFIFLNIILIMIPSLANEINLEKKY